MIRFLIFGVLGILGSVVFTAAKGAISARRYDFTGQASLVLFPFFGLIAFLYPMIAIRMGAFPWYLRCAILMLAFFIAQFVVGLGLSKLNICPWRYSGPFALGGLVRIQDAPMWFASGILVEWLYPHVKAMAAVLG